MGEFMSNWLGKLKKCSVSVFVIGRVELVPWSRME